MPSPYYSRHDNTQNFPRKTKALIADARRKFAECTKMIADRKLRRRQLTEDGNVEITGRDLREKTPPVGQGNLFAQAAV